MYGAENSFRSAERNLLSGWRNVCINISKRRRKAPCDSYDIDSGEWGRKALSLLKVFLVSSHEWRKNEGYLMSNFLSYIEFYYQTLLCSLLLFSLSRSHTTRIISHNTFNHCWIERVDIKWTADRDEKDVEKMSGFIRRNQGSKIYHPGLPRAPYTKCGFFTNHILLLWKWTKEHSSALKTWKVTKPSFTQSSSQKWWHEWPQQCVILLWTEVLDAKKNTDYITWH